MNILYIIAGAGCLGGLFFYLKQFIGNKSNILDAVHKVKQNLKIDEIKKIDKKQNVVKIEIKKGEKVSEETKTKIKEIQKKAVNDIKEVLSEDKAVGEMVDDFNDDLSDW